jgi:hypothetical protein
MRGFTFLSRLFSFKAKNKPSAFLDVKVMNRIVVNENSSPPAVNGDAGVASMKTENMKLIHRNKVDSIVTINGTIVVPKGSSNSKSLILLDTTSTMSYVLRKVLKKTRVSIKIKRHFVDRILWTYVPKVAEFFDLESEAFQMIDIVKMYDEMTKTCLKYGTENIIISNPEFTVSYIDKNSIQCDMSFVPFYVERLDKRDKNADEFIKQFDVDCRTLSVNKYTIPVKSIGMEE